MNNPEAKRRSTASKTTRSKRQVKGDGFTEDMVLQLLERNPLNRYGYTMVARQLGCSTEQSIRLLDALAKRKAVQVSSSPIGEVLFAPLNADASLGLETIRERGDLRADHNGALRHWELCMSIRR